MPCHGRLRRAFYLSGFDRCRHKVLVVDDNEINRNILSEMLGDEYDIIEAENGVEAIALLQKESINISVVLLDVVMPVMDGYGVLTAMKYNQWIDDIPVIMISSDNSIESISRAYDLGVTEFIGRPFDKRILRHRVVNTIMLYAKQKKLVNMVADQIYEKEKESRLMIDILSHIVEFRNGESGMHVIHVQMYTEILLRNLLQITDKYNISETDISLIGKASALHDIGKISVPDHILNKPGRLTPEEFEIMKSHSAAGASMLDEITMYRDEPLVKVAYEICRWHHERYDGKGYPDGLKGDEIPISAQIVALADVYDALTSERVYKKAYSNEKAVSMILNGECGSFDPLLLECLKRSSPAMCEVKDMKEPLPEEIKDHENLSLELMQYNELSPSEEVLRLLDYEKLKNNFYASVSDELYFEYTVFPHMLKLYPNKSGILESKEIIAYPLHNEQLTSIISEKDISKLSFLLKNTSPELPIVEYECSAFIKGKKRNIKIICSSVWNQDSSYSGAIGKVIDNKGEKTMTLKECYAAIGGDYDSVLSRLMTEKLVQKFVTKFLADKSFENLVNDMREEKYEEAFREAHTLKGVCQNLSFTRLFTSSSELTEALRNKNYSEASALLPIVNQDYLRTVEAIKELQ